MLMNNLRSRLRKLYEAVPAVSSEEVLDRRDSSSASTARGGRLAAALVGIAALAVVTWLLYQIRPGEDVIPTPGAASERAINGLPAGAPRLVVAESEGAVWVLEDDTATQWMPRVSPESGCGYLWARFGPDGVVYASRVSGNLLVIDRISEPGTAEPVLEVPHDTSEDLCHETAIIGKGFGYESSFAAVSDGLLLAEHVALDDGQCDAGGSYCAEETEEVWFLELRGWTSLADPGVRVGPVGDHRPTDANFVLSLLLSGESATDETVTIVQGVNKDFGWKYFAVSVPNLAIRACCPSNEDVERAVGTIVPGPSLDSFVLADNGIGRMIDEPPASRPERLLLVTGSSSRVLYQAESGVDIGEPVSSSSDLVAFVFSHGDSDTVAVTDTEGRVTETDFALSSIASLDWAAATT
jgi:hypothetical protein